MKEILKTALVCVVVFVVLTATISAINKKRIEAGKKPLLV